MLNARRHRSGDHRRTPSDRVRLSACSTPEGIEAAITLPRRLARIEGRGECSTPEGIEAAITVVPLLLPFGEPEVLNARRHRSGDHTGTKLTVSDPKKLCSTPEGIEAAITRLFWRKRALSGSAQRPKASKRRSPERAFSAFP